jgi:hypothetical protein
MGTLIENLHRFLRVTWLGAKSPCYLVTMFTIVTWEMIHRPEKSDFICVIRKINVKILANEPDLLRCVYVS